MDAAAGARNPYFLLSGYEEYREREKSLRRLQGKLFEYSQLSEDKQVTRTFGEEVEVTGECNYSSRGYARGTEGCGREKR